MDYGEILSNAWQTIWKHKILWLFGILAGCASQGGSSGGQINYRFNGENPPPAVERFFQSIPDWQITAIVIGLIVLVMILVILAIVLGSIGRIGLIKGTLMAKSKKEDEKLSFSEVWQVSLPYFWRVVGLNLLIGLVFFVVFGMLGVIALVFGILTLGIGMLCILPLLCLLVPVGWALGIVIQQANVALVVEDLSITQAVQRGWEVFRDNLGEMIVMGLILLVGGGIVSLLIAAPLGVAIASLVGVLIVGGERAANSGLLMAGLCFVGYLPVLIFFNGILQAFIQSAWTLTYTALSGYGVPEPPAEQLPSAY